MSLPGLQLSAPTEVDTAAAAPLIHELPKGSEWRFEVSFGSTVEVKLLYGTAELFGTELAPNQTYTFTGTKAAIYTWHGCRLHVTGDCAVEYTAEETPMNSYANTHFALEKIRHETSLQGSKEGPRVLVVGPDDAGKTSLVKILTAYATKVGRQPIAVNLDPREGMLSVPGSLTATAVRSILDVEEGWGSSPTSGPSPVPVKLPLVYYYGQESPEENKAIYKPLVTRMALAVTSRMAEDVDAREAGCVIDTPGIISQGKDGYDIIQHIVSEFSVTILLVLGSERLYTHLLRRFDNQTASTNEPISVLKISKSGGCVDRDEGYMTAVRQAQIREYFFGDARRALSPHTQMVELGSVHIYKYAESCWQWRRPEADRADVTKIANTLLPSLLPGGATDDDPTSPASSAAHQKLFEPLTTPSSLPQLHQSILALLHAAPSDSQETLRDAAVLGFVYVAEVDEKKGRLRVLSPVAGRLPGNVFVWGGWPGAVGELVG
ncbi:MAG: hypothetical protein M1819_001222 [Sarea resinae]|nr:MAG: hypothetical protein M1819_001222 [Sarea resinae]